MSATTVIGSGLGQHARLSRAEIVLTRRLLSEVWKISRWVWPIAGLVAAGAAAAVSQFTPISQTIWEMARYWPRWFLFAIAILLVSVNLPVLVLHGVTRRAVVRSLGLAGAVTSLGWAGLMALGHAVERFVFGRLDWPDRLTGGHLFATGYDLPGMLAEYGLVFFGYAVTGALIGACYYRFGGHRGTLALPVAALPLVTIEILLAGLDGSLGSQRWGALPSNGLVAVVLALAVIALAVQATYLVLREVPIRAR